MKISFTKEYFDDNREKIMKTLILLIVLAAAVLVFLLKTGNEEQVKIEKNAVQAAEKTETAESLVVDVGGAVNEPQVVELKPGSRVCDAIDAAGGLAENADITELNRAAEVTDGEKVYIPALGNKAAAEKGGDSSETGKININSASSSELQTLTGIGPAKAEDIIDYRESSGKFKKIEDLKKVSGIGDKTFEKLKDMITV